LGLLQLDEGDLYYRSWQAAIGWKVTHIIDWKGTWSIKIHSYRTFI